MQPRVVVREIIGKAPYFCCAAYTDSPFLYNKSILHILAKNNGAQPLLRGLAAYLNSAFTSFYLAYWGRKANRRLFPKLLAEDFVELPIPHAEALIALGDIQAGAISDETLDKEVFATLGITREEQSIINLSFEWLQ